MSADNKGFDPKTIQEYREKMKKNNKSYVIIESEDNSDEYKNFYFIGEYEGKEVLYDTVVYTLRLHHNSELYEIAESRAAIRFPEYKQVTEDEHSAGLNDLEEEIGLYMAEVMMELEEEGEVRVSEHVEVDPDIDFGVGLDAALNVDMVTSSVISKFVKNYNEKTLQLDDTLYTFQIEEEDEGVI